MARRSKHSIPVAVRLVVLLLLLGCAQMSSAAGTWSVLSLPQRLGDLPSPRALAVDAGDLYVADVVRSQIQERDARGAWSVVAAQGTHLGEVNYPMGLAAGRAGDLYVADWNNGSPRIQQRDARGLWSVIATEGASALAVDAAGSLYVAEFDYKAGAAVNPRVRKRDARGSWSVIATAGTALGQIGFLPSLAVDPVGDLYVADHPADAYAGGRVQKRDAQGNWSLLASSGSGLGQVEVPLALAADAAGNLYVAEPYTDSEAPGVFNPSRIQKRDAQGSWSVMATQGPAPGQVRWPWALAMDDAGDLYVADSDSNGGAISQIQERDAQGKWSVIATGDQAPGEVLAPSALAVDPAGNLYVADHGNLGQNSDNGDRLQERDALGSWSVIATEGSDFGQVGSPTALAVDTAGNLYVADLASPYFTGETRIQRRDAQGNWSLMVSVYGQVTALAVDGAGNLYVAGDFDSTGAGSDYVHIQKRDAQGNWNWTDVASEGPGPGQIFSPSAMAVGADGTLYVADHPGSGSRIQQRDAQGHWSVVSPSGTSAGQVISARALAVDAVGNLYVAEDGRIQQRNAEGHWSILASQGASALAVDAGGRLYIAQVNAIQRRDAQGHWLVLATGRGEPGEVHSPAALVVSADGTLSVADSGNSDGQGDGRIQQRDAQGNWSVQPTDGTDPGQLFFPRALALDATGQLILADPIKDLLEQRDAQGNWWVIATAGADYGQGVGEVSLPFLLAVDAAGDLYVADRPRTVDCQNNRIQKRDAQGHWSVIATAGMALGQIGTDCSPALAVDPAGNLYVADHDYDSATNQIHSRIQKRDLQGNWSIIDGGDTGQDQVVAPSALAADSAGNLYVADFGYASPECIQQRDAQGHWSVIATFGSGLGQVSGPAGLAVDVAGNLYVADTGNNRVLKYTPAP